jgi:integrase
MKVKVTKQQRRGTVRWVVDWRDRSDKRHQPQFPTKEAAEAEADRIRETLRAQRGRTPELPEDITWTGLFERVMADRGDLKPRTLESYRTMHRLYLAPAFGATPVVKLSRSQLREFLRRHLTRYATNTVRLMGATLHVVLEEATDDGLIPANPCAGLRRKLKLTRKKAARADAMKKKAMTQPQRDAFLAKAATLEPWWAPAWTVQVLCGLRPGELYALEERDVDFGHQTLRVERALSDDGSRVEACKDDSARDVDLTPATMQALRLAISRHHHAKVRALVPRPLFGTPTGGYATPTIVRQAFRRVCKAVGLVEGTKARFSPHGLRHTYASLLLQAGVDVYYVSRMLGHADIGMTVGTYGAWLQPNRRPGIDALDPVASTVQANG